MTDRYRSGIAHDPAHECRQIHARQARAARRALLAMQEAEWNAVGKDDTAHKPKETTS
ncbi:MAG: hypothetical protein Q8M24_08375 [Pseudolabrys sp.]|nr:hypothetical protein [Pseudolabrys sp.]MDP2295462.1 hypothetical protein [Pseudolabrys sp.]